MPVFVNGEILAVVHVVSKPGSRFDRKDFYFLKDMTETVGNAIVKAKKHWEISPGKDQRSVKRLPTSFPLFLILSGILWKGNPEMLCPGKTE